MKTTESKYVAVEAEWLETILPKAETEFFAYCDCNGGSEICDQYPDCVSCAMAHSNGKLKPLTPEQQMVGEMMELISELPEWKDKVSNVWPATWEPIDRLIAILSTLRGSHENN